MRPLEDLTGQVFGKRRVIGFLRTENTKSGRKRIWEVECSVCEQRYELNTYEAKKAAKKGCRACELKDRVGPNNSFYKHGKKHKLTYEVWCAMRQRCNNKDHKDYKYYGGRGISVCSEWDDYEQFLSDMGVKPDGYSIDRINNDGDYCKANCKWIPIGENIGKRNRDNAKIK